MGKLFVTLSIICIALGCSKSSGPKQPAEMYLESGTWRVTEITVGGVDKTALFFDYTFTFNSNGTVNGVNAGLNETGTWSVVTVVTGGLRLPQLKLNFPAAGICSNLNQDWDLYGVGTMQISGNKNFIGSGDVYSLTLQKN